MRTIFGGFSGDFLISGEISVIKYVALPRNDQKLSNLFLRAGLLQNMTKNGTVRHTEL